MLRNPAIYQWRPVGLSDARDGQMGFPGACKVLQNLIHDAASSYMLAPRPGATTIASALSGLGVISVTLTLGTRIYGMAASTSISGYDAPFCYDTSTSSLVTITGATSSNTPVTQATSGAWTPPVMVLVGNYIVITHPGYTLTTGPVGLVDLSTLAYSSGNLKQGTTNIFTAVPNSVGSFYNRAWYAVGNVTYFSDALTPLVQTDTGQQLTLGTATENITAFVPQGISTATQGILASLVAFKPNSVWQITGDWNFGGSTTGGNLALNQLTASIGCTAPRTIQPTPAGIMFLAVDGIRTIPPLSMVVSEPQPDVVFPFYNCMDTSRACAAFSANMYRISLDTVTTTDIAGRFEFWYSLRTGKWTGPHTFPADTITPFGNSFVVTQNASVGTLFQSNAISSGSDTFTEGGAAVAYSINSTVVDMSPPMLEKASVEVTVNAVYGSSPFMMQVLNADGSMAGTATGPVNVGRSTWGSFVWGAGTWGTSQYNSVSEPLNFPAPLVFKTPQFIITGNSVPGVRFGRFDFRYEALQYTGAN